MPLFWKYVKQNVKFILVLILFCAVFAVTFALYRLPPEAVLYPALLCLGLGILFLMIRFRGAERKHRELEGMSRQSAAVMPKLTFAETISDGDYASIIENLKREIAALEADSATKYRDMMEYYTLWVHQIKTPIASMRLQLQKEDTAESLRLQADLFRIEQYVEMVLAFLRLDSDSSDYVFKEYRADDIIRQTVKKFSQEFIGRKIRLEYEPVEYRIITDEKWLSFVLEQIISNALKYTRGGNDPGEAGAQGRVRIYSPEPKVLCVEDTGIGIAPEDLPRIFEKGYTGYNGRIDGRASGIGLYLCKRVCDNLGIGISASSEMGKGTVIRLEMDQYALKAE